MNSKALLASSVALLALVCVDATVSFADIEFASGTFTKHPCLNSNAKCDSGRTTPYSGTNALTSYYGKSRNPSFKVTATWQSPTGDAANEYCYCRLRANMNGFSDPVASIDPRTDATGVTSTGGALTDSKLEPWGQHWYLCWDQNSDEPTNDVAETKELIITGPSDAPFVNLPDGYYHFAIGCTEDGPTNPSFDFKDLFFKIDNVAPETTISPYIAPLTSSIPTHTGSLQSYDPAAKDHRLRYAKTSDSNPTNKVPVGLFDFKLSVVDYHGSANADVAPYNPYDTPIVSPNIHGEYSGKTFYAELETITYQCKIDDGSWLACDSTSFGTTFASNNYGHYYYSDTTTDATDYAGVFDGERFITTKSLSSGTHVLMVKATDLAGNTEMPTMYSFYVAPFTKGGSNSGCTYGYKLTSDSATAEYSMSDFDLSQNNYVEFSDLTDGDHTIQVFAKDEFGHETASSGYQSVTWTVDRTGPTTYFHDSWTLRNTARDTSYVENSGSASLTDARYEWGFDTTTFQTPIFSRYSIDGHTYTMDGFVTNTTVSGNFATSGISMPPHYHTFPKNTFPVGSHSVKILGIDYVGNMGTPAEDTFTVEELDTILNCDKCAICDWDPTTGCTNCKDIESAYVSDAITFDISAKTDGEAIKFKYDYIFSDDGTSTSFQKGQHIPEFTVRNIGEGKYYVMAKGRTLGGTVDATPSCVMVSTDINPPEISINTDLQRINNPARLPKKIAGTVMDLNWKYTGMSYTIKQTGNPTAIDSGNSVKNVAGTSGRLRVDASSDNENIGIWELDISDIVLSEGQYQLTLTATDKAAHSATAMSHTWIIDIGPPDTHIVNGPATATGSTSATITFACEESDEISFCTYKYRMTPATGDDGWVAAEDCDRSVSKYCRIELTDVPAGVNTIEVKAVDLAGNEDASSQYYTWIVYNSEQFAAFQNLSSFTSPWGMGPVKFTS